MAESRGRTRQLVIAALIAALLAASAWVTLPIGAVPVTLQVFVVVLALLLLDPEWAGASLAIYLTMGAVGLPVFAGAKGGLGVIAGPTGGYLIGFFVAAVAGASLRRMLAYRAPRTAADVSAAVFAVLAIYVIGTVQLGLVLHMPVEQAVVTGVVPFIVPDIFKAFAAVAVAESLRRALPQQA